MTGTSDATAPLSPAGTGAALFDLITEILPGDTDWPPGTEIGVQHILRLRCIEEKGEAALARLAGILGDYGLPFSDESPEARIAAVGRLEAGEPALFAWLRDTAYFSYYEDPAVIAVFNARGTPLVARPHIEGYLLEPFDPATQTPQHGRGHWIRTEDVRRLDISGLELDSRITSDWGLRR